MLIFSFILRRDFFFLFRRKINFKGGERSVLVFLFFSFFSLCCIERPEICHQNFASLVSQIQSLEIEQWKVSRGLEVGRVGEGEKHAGISCLGISTTCSQWNFYQVAELVNYIYMCVCLCKCMCI